MGVGGRATASWLELESTASSDEGLLDLEGDGAGGVSPSWDMCASTLGDCAAEGEVEVDDDEVA
jgi:hypothetical protein